MRPIPETLVVIGELEPFHLDGSLLDAVKRSAAQAQEIAPDLAGISIARAEHGVTFTLVATHEEIAALDGVQYLTSGPCLEVMEDGQGKATTLADLFNERRWHALAQASAAAGIRSTLTFPIVDGEEVIETVNLYGLADDTFDGKHGALAALFSAWAPGVVTNSDLSFSTRRLAEGAPEQLRVNAVIDTATGILSMMRDITVRDAKRELGEAAQRAGVPVATLAKRILNMHGKFP